MATLIYQGVQTTGRRRIAVILQLPWIALWLTIFPLFHVHPEADHAHGQTHHHHGGLVHSVFSQDLPCEFGTNSKPSFGEKARLIGIVGAFPTHSHFLNHSEITLSAIYQASDEPIKKQFAGFVGPVNQDHSRTYWPARGKEHPEQRIFLPYQLTNPYVSRPPPVLTI